MAAIVFHYADNGDLTRDGRFTIADIWRCGWLLIVAPGMLTFAGLGTLFPRAFEFFEIGWIDDGSAFWIVAGLLGWALYAAILAFIEHGIVRPAIHSAGRWLARVRPRREPKGKPHIDLDGNPQRRIGEQ